MEARPSATASSRRLLFASRFEEGDGTNPEELIAAAHAACFTMALSNILAENGHTPDSVRTRRKSTSNR